MVIDIDKWTEIYATVKKHKLRTGLTAFGVFWGIFMLVVLLGAGKGLEKGITNDFNVAKNAVFVWSQRSSIPYKGLNAGRNIRMTDEFTVNIVSDVDIMGKIGQYGHGMISKRADAMLAEFANCTRAKLG